MEVNDYRLPLDFSRCSNSECPLKENCKRWLDNPPSSGDTYFSVTKFISLSSTQCENQIKISKKTW